MKNIKKFGELNEADNILPKSGTKIKYVADANDRYTASILKQIWDYWSEEMRAQQLEKMGHSTKYATARYEDLTGDIQSRIVSMTSELPESNKSKTEVFKFPTNEEIQKISFRKTIGNAEHIGFVAGANWVVDFLRTEEKKEFPTHEKIQEFSRRKTVGDDKRKGFITGANWVIDFLTQQK